MMKSGVLVLGTILAVGTAQGAAAGGLSLTMEMRGDRDKLLTTTRMQADGPNFRGDFSQGGGRSSAKETGYLLTRDGGKTMVLVNPKDKTYMKWDTETMAQFAGAAMKMMKMKVSDVKVDLVSEEAGPPMHGYSTRHYKFRSTYTMETSFMGRSSTVATVREEDIWATTKIDLSAFHAWQKNQSFQTGNADMEALIEAQKKKAKGFPLKTVAVTTTTDSHGKTETHSSTMVVTEVAEGAIPASAFEIPSDYKEQKLGGDAEDKPAASQGAKDGDEESPRPARKPGLGDIFRLMR